MNDKQIQERLCVTGMGDHDHVTPVDSVEKLVEHVEKLEKQNEIMREALEHYGNRMDSGGIARKALSQCDEIDKGEG